MTLQFYHRLNLTSAPWSSLNEGTSLRDYFAPLIQNGVERYSTNISSEIHLLAIDQELLPLTVKEGVKGAGSYVDSPSAHYIGCAYEKIQELPLALKASCRALLSPLSLFFSLCEFEKAVYVNNWLLPTGLYPKLDREQLARIVDCLKERYPGHALVFRSLDGKSSSELLASLKELQCDLIGTRQIYYLDGKEEEPYRSRMYKSDLKLAAKSRHKFVLAEELTDEEISRVLALYRSLYIDKYTSYSADYTPDFIRLLLKQRLFELWLLRKEEKIDAVYLSFERGDQMTTPLFGYDREKPQEAGLYRQLATHAAERARKKGLLFNQSSGAGSYKLLRRARPVMEYNAVYTKHLPPLRRAPWKLLSLLMNRLGLPLIKKYAL